MKTKKILFSAVALLLVLAMMPLASFAIDFNESVTNDYYNVLYKNEYALAPGATETEMVLNNDNGSRRQIVHIFEVDTKNENIEVLPGYYGIDKLDPDNLSDNTHWTDAKLSDTVAYYEGMGYNVVGAMNTALAYDSNAPYGYMVMNGVVLGTPDIHKGSQTYLAIDAEGNCELRSMSTPLDGSEVTAISANFGWLIKDGELVSKTVERTSAAASRSMIGIKADGTLVFCQTDGRISPQAVGLSNYEMGEMMLALGCVNAVNCDGGGSSTFISKREGETETTMRSIPSDGAERATINSVIIVSNAKATGEFDHAVLNSEYDYYAPGAAATINIKGVDAVGSPAELPTEGISWQLSNSSFGTVANGVFTSNGTKGDVTVQMLYNGNVVGEKLIHVVDPDTFALALDETVLPYGKSMTIDFDCTYGADDWAVCVEGAYTLTLSDTAAATLKGNVLYATSDESITGVNVTATYIPDTTVSDVLAVTYGKGSEIIFDFEDGDRAGFVGFDEAKQWCIDNGVNNTLVGSDPLGGQFSEDVDGDTFMATVENGGQVRNGKYALAWSLDNTTASFAGWTYNVLFNIGETIVLRDVANGKNATTLGMWLYIPEGATGLAFQAQLYVKNANGSLTCKQSHFTFTTVSGVQKNLNSCTEADIPESRWVYASIDLTPYDYICTPVATDESNSRSPSFVRTYIKPMTPAVHTFYIDDITLDYSSAVDDRVMPTISNVSYATADESVVMKGGETISGNSIAFSATIADNMKLDYTTGKILVDGNELPNVTASGKVLAGDTVTLTSGVHTVTFEIKDALGNAAKVTRTFTISGDSVITLGGHNDSGAMPEYDSVYYVDVNVADLTAVNKLTAVLKLQDANTWEPQGITTAAGFKASYSLNKVESILTVTIERNGYAIDTDATAIVSIPVRLWSWEAINHTTGAVITPEAQYATGYCPIVTVDCEVLTGTVEFAGSNYKDYLGAFGGEISVETMINDIANPWHKHDTELTVLNKDVTCTTDGYTGRTYCETCKSVIDWGTTLVAGGHTYEIVNDQVVCGCGETITTTGIVKIGSDLYYLMAGKVTTGWQSTQGGWCYASTTTKKVCTGEKVIGGLTYVFDENGVLTTGVWVKNEKGSKYSFGPGYYNRTWQKIDGKNYYFGRDSYAYTGIRFVKDNPDANPKWYNFGEDGAVQHEGMYDYTGLIEFRGDIYYCKDGYTQFGLQYVDGNFYYFRTGSGFDRVGFATRNERYYVSDTNGLTYPNGTPVAKAWYEFDAEGKMVIKNGLVDGYFYENNKPVPYKGLIEVDGNFYYIADNGKAVANKNHYVLTTNGLAYANGVAITKGTYTFDAEGKMVIKNGLVDGYFYENNKPVPYKGLIEVDGNFYYIADNGKAVANKNHYVLTTNGLAYANGVAITKGTYTFDAEGKMVIKNGLVDGYFYENNKPVPYKGLIEVDGSFYYIADHGKTVAGVTRYVLNTNGLTYNGEAIKKGNYTFDADGKMILK